MFGTNGTNKAVEIITVSHYDLYRTGDKLKGQFLVLLITDHRSVDVIKHDRCIFVFTCCVLA